MVKMPGMLSRAVLQPKKGDVINIALSLKLCRYITTGELLRLKLLR